MLGDFDVFVNVVGGVKVTETSADLAIVMAIVSSYREIKIPKEMFIFGEVGLSGEIRPVPNGSERINEAIKHGFKKAIVPIANLPKGKLDGFEIHGVKNLQEALNLL